MTGELLPVTGPDEIAALVSDLRRVAWLASRPNKGKPAHDDLRMIAADTIERLATSALAPSVEPFGYWVEQKYAEPALLRKPAYIPEPSDIRTVTPLYAETPVREKPREARAVLNRILVAANRLRRSEITAQEFDEYGLALLATFTLSAVPHSGDEVGR